jgi:hypothetical protein
MKAKERLTPCQKWRKERNAEMLADFHKWLAEGYNVTEATEKACAKFRVCSQTLRILRRSNGESPKSEWRKRKDGAMSDRAAKAWEAKRAGASLPALAKQLGVTYSTIYRDLYRYEREHTQEADDRGTDTATP